MESEEVQQNSPLRSKTNVAVMLTAPGYTSSEAKVTNWGKHDKKSSSYPSTWDWFHVRQWTGTSWIHPRCWYFSTWTNSRIGQHTTFYERFQSQWTSKSASWYQWRRQSTGTPKSDLLSWHHQLVHLPFNNIKAMAQSGFLPIRLQHVRTPLCSSCLYGKATRQPCVKPSKLASNSHTTIHHNHLPQICVSLTLSYLLDKPVTLR